MMEYQLNKALQQPGCAICTVVRQARDNFFRWFVIETYGEVPMLLDLAEGGFCEYHAWEVARVTGRRLSYTYEFLVAAEYRKLETLLVAATDASLAADKNLSWWRRLLALAQRKGDRAYKKALKSTDRQRPCPLCRTLQQNEQYAADILAQMTSDDGVRDLLERSDGLCLPHLRMTLHEAPPATAAFLVSDALERLGRLREGFKEYYHKEDYRFHHEPKGEEQSTWLRAVERFAGRCRVPCW